MDNFIWIGSQLVNLLHVIRFTVEDDGARVVVYLSGTDPKNATFVIDGDAAVNLMAILSEVEIGKNTPGYAYDMAAAQVTLSAIPVNVDMEAREEEFDGIVEISDPNTRR
jgi:hypothetical protein